METTGELQREADTPKVDWYRNDTILKSNVGLNTLGKPCVREVLLALAVCPGLEPSTLRKLISVFGDAEGVWNASKDEWLEACHMQAATAEILDRWRRNYSNWAIEETLRHRQIHCAVQGDEIYPSAFCDLADPPLVAFARGNIENIRMVEERSHRTVGIVGTRRASAYGLEAARWVSETLSAHGYVIVSGMALGIDAAAHRAALDVHGVTVAVLGCGVDVCYPAGHQRIYRDICKTGVVWSEYAPGSPVTKYRFPERNRLIAAFAKQLVVIQAGEKSGALRTVDSALELGREVFVVPGPITSVHFRGSHRLLQQGATILIDPIDILVDLGAPRTEERVQVSERWQGIYDSLDDPRTCPELAQITGLPISAVYAGCLELEMMNWIEKVPGGLYRRSSRA